MGIKRSPTTGTSHEEPDTVGTRPLETIRIIRDGKTIVFTRAAAAAATTTTTDGPGQVTAPVPPVLTAVLKSTLAFSQPDMTFFRGGLARGGAGASSTANSNGSDKEQDKTQGKTQDKTQDKTRPDLLAQHAHLEQLGTARFHDLTTSKVDLVMYNNHELKFKKTFKSVTGLGWCRWVRGAKTDKRDSGDNSSSSSRKRADGGDVRKDFYLVAHCTRNAAPDIGRASDSEGHDESGSRGTRCHGRTSSSSCSHCASIDKKLLADGVRVAVYRSSGSMGGVRVRESLTPRSSSSNCGRGGTSSGVAAGLKQVFKAGIGEYREDKVEMLVDGLSAEQREEILMTAVVERERRRRADDEAGSIVEEIVMGVLL
ncbi:uncharacterized protein B0I36DRAFT_355702 [Microdochium trichocladiopsis]|uniref:Uncharacterized protein n=1 Tax=Microdochium trichocladiopsis TaxID=1682393 RepID=A0A9P8XSA7_9PEZI|nr:uncharacterized protein B0I36DRAFT_355702 [Microdochium trichocladiopsis]KAH7014499.1 hypothetical protein B0I36DRAFT_355702 [Microdochium trichocladiopsis]